MTVVEREKVELKKPVVRPQPYYHGLSDAALSEARCGHVDRPPASEDDG